MLIDLCHLEFYIQIKKRDPVMLRCPVYEPGLVVINRRLSHVLVKPNYYNMQRHFLGIYLQKHFLYSLVQFLSPKFSSNPFHLSWLLPLCCSSSDRTPQWRPCCSIQYAREFLVLLLLMQLVALTELIPPSFLNYFLEPCLS